MTILALYHCCKERSNRKPLLALVCDECLNWVSDCIAIQALQMLKKISTRHRRAQVRTCFMISKQHDDLCCEMLNKFGMTYYYKEEAIANPAK